VVTSGSFARAFVVVNRAFGAAAVVAGLCLLAKCGWHLLTGARDWSQSYFAVLFGAALVIVGIVWLRAPLGRPRGDAVSDVSAPDH